MENKLIAKTEELIDRQLQEHIKRYKKWQYKNTAFLFISLFLFYYFAETHVMQNLILRIGDWGYLGALLVGVLLVSTFTVVPAMYMIYALAESLNPIEVAIFAGLGGLIGDYIIFRFLKNKVFDELKPIFLALGGNFLIRMFRTSYFAWLVPLIGAAIIAYPPLPDEAGIGILGLSKLKNWQFMLISFLLNSLGIFIAVIIAKYS